MKISTQANGPDSTPIASLRSWVCSLLAVIRCRAGKDWPFMNPEETITLAAGIKDTLFPLLSLSIMHYITLLRRSYL